MTQQQHEDLAWWQQRCEMHAHELESLRAQVRHLEAEVERWKAAYRNSEDAHDTTVTWINQGGRVS